MSEAAPAPILASEGCPKCGRADFSSGSGKTLHIKSCQGPKPGQTPGDNCPKCGRSDFTSGSGKTLHVKSCKGSEKQQRLEEPCPKCGGYDFNSLSGRTLHIKSCKGDQPVQKPGKPTIAVTTEAAEKQWYCPYCKKDIFGWEKTFINHLDKCYPIQKNEHGHVFDQKLKIWVVQAPTKCYGQPDLVKTMGCWPPRLGMLMSNHQDARGHMGCWMEGIGACIYSYPPSAQKKVCNKPVGDIGRIHGEMTGHGASQIVKISCLATQEEQAPEDEEI
jgi:Zn finger protein HypA/HybF involved in hydrogenase expression